MELIKFSFTAVSIPANRKNYRRQSRQALFGSCDDNENAVKGVKRAENLFFRNIDIVRTASVELANQLSFQWRMPREEFPNVFIFLRTSARVYEQVGLIHQLYSQSGIVHVHLNVAFVEFHFAISEMMLDLNSENFKLEYLLSFITT